MGSDPITPPILVFGRPYSNPRATQRMRARAEEPRHLRPRPPLAPATSSPTAPSPRRPTALVRDWAATSSPATARSSSPTAARTAPRLRGGQRVRPARQGPGSLARRAAVAGSRAGRRPAQTLTFTSGRARASASSTAASTSSTASCSPPSGDVAPRSWTGPAPTWSSPATRGTVHRRVGRRTWFNPGVIGMPANDGPRMCGRPIQSTRAASCSPLTAPPTDHVEAAAAVRRAATPTVTRAPSPPACGRASTSSPRPSVPRRPSASAAAPWRPKPLPGARVGRSPLPALRGEGQGEGRPQRRTARVTPAPPSAPWRSAPACSPRRRAR